MKAKKIISLVLVLAVMLGTFATIFSFSASAIDNADGTYSPSEGTETYRYYFVMPKAWENEYYEKNGSTPGFYFWGGTDHCNEVGKTGGKDWPGYRMKKVEGQDYLYYLDIPKDNPYGIFSNFVDGGMDPEDPIFLSGCQTVDLRLSDNTECGPADYAEELKLKGFSELIEDAWDNGTMDQFGENADCFEYLYGDIFMTYNKMIFIVDLSIVEVEGLSENTTKPKNGGQWFFLYDNGYYGSWPTKEMAEEQAANGNGVYATLESAINQDASELPSQDPSVEPTTKNAPTQAVTDGTQKGSGKATPDTSTPLKSSSASNAVTTNKSAIQTGDVVYAIALLTILALAAGVVFFVRRKRFN